MERLDIVASPERPNIEASIHFARYAIAKDLVKGKRVLDIACGEGYGCFLLKQAGADRVVGVDVCSETVQRAKTAFGAPGLEFIAADALALQRIFSPGEFDVVVSIETVEHLADAQSFLRAIMRVAGENAVIIVSCPNDHWYFPEENQRNPYHLRKYRFEEFQKLTTDALGNNVRWSLGSGVFGFGSTPLSVSDDFDQIPDSWMSYVEAGGGYVVNGERTLGLSPSNCSYFVGVWNSPTPSSGIAVFPISMDDYALMVDAFEGGLSCARSEIARLLHELDSSAQDAGILRSSLDSMRSEMAVLSATVESLQADKNSLRTDLTATLANIDSLSAELSQTQRIRRQLELRLQANNMECELTREALLAARSQIQAERSAREREKSLAQADLDSSRKHSRDTGLRLHALRNENELLRQNVNSLRSECDILRAGNNRYVKLRSFVPASVRYFVARAFRAIRHGKVK